MVNIDMSWDEIKRRAKNGASISVLADLNGVTSKVMGRVIADLEAQTGEKLVFESPKKAIKKGMKSQRIDHQKVVEMYEAGKPVKEIAAALQTYEQNIYNHIAKYKKEKKAQPEPVQEPKQDPRDEAADEAMLDVVLEQMRGLEDELINLESQAAPLRYQLNKWRKVKEAIENDTL